MTFSLESNAKINLFLKIVRRRPDGFHELETVMVPIDLADEMTFSTHQDLILTCNDRSLPTDSRNLVIRAAVLMQKKYGVKKGANIDLKKRIPLGAGLGGGSSNATFALKGLNRLWELNLSETELETLANELGSDTAFFVKNQPAFARGRGEKLTPLKIKQPIPILLLNFGFGSSTAWAYRHCKPGLAGIDFDLKKTLLTLNDIPSLLRNDLQLPVFAKFPILSIALEFMKKQKGILGAMMSGSGSTLFAVLESEKAGMELAGSLKKRFSGNLWIQQASILHSSS